MKQDQRSSATDTAQVRSRVIVKARAKVCFEREKAIEIAMSNSRIYMRGGQRVFCCFELDWISQALLVCEQPAWV